MVKPYPVAKVPNMARYPEGSRVQYCTDGRVFVWYPKPLRHVVTFAVPECCPTCQRATVSATVVEAMAI